MASILVRGSISLANGEATALRCSSSGSMPNSGSVLSYASSLDGGACSVEIRTNPASLPTNDESVRIARHLLLTDLLPNVLLEGTGVRLTLEWIERPGTPPMRVVADSVPAGADRNTSVNVTSLHQLAAILPPVRWSLRDFNHGLLEREDCPFMFYRAIETVGRAVAGQQEKSDLNWPEMHRRLGTSRSDLAILERLRNDHGHGAHTYFSASEHGDMKSAWKRVIEQAVHYLLGNRQVIQQWLRDSNELTGDEVELAMSTLPRA